MSSRGRFSLSSRAAETARDHSYARRLLNMQIQVGIITISDRASAGDYQDLGGPALKEAAQKAGWQVVAEAIVTDDANRIQDTIRSFSKQGCGLILATGGTGIGPRDVTPEAIRAIMRVELPGFGEVMRAESMKITPNSI